MFCKILVFVSITVLMVKSESECDSFIGNVLTTLIYPSEQDTIQTKVLRRDLFKKLEEALLTEDDDYQDENNYLKRTLSSLARNNNLPFKRNLQALARGGHIRTIQDDDEDLKRSIANLAKNGQLPLQNEEKRGIESLARNGELPRKRELQEFLDSLNDKRNIGSLARSYNFPSMWYGNGKRFVGSLARNGDLNRFNNADKRNIASLARDGNKFTGKRNDINNLKEDDVEMNKRNIASIKAQYKPKYKRDIVEVNDNKKTRNKRQVDYYEELNDEYPAPVYQNQNVYDYEEFMKALTGNYPVTEKRFLGSVARSGWFRPSSMSSRFTNVDKRHIGSLARLGWLPTYRSVRRFNRSGRSTINEECSTERAIAADGQTEDDPITENALSLDDKRFLLQPAVDRLLLQKLYMRRRTK